MRVLPVTERDLPPQDEAGLRRWFGRMRWKFGTENWFTEAESMLETRDFSQAHRTVYEAVVQAVGNSPPAPAVVRASSLVSAFERKLAVAEATARLASPTTILVTATPGEKVESVSDHAPSPQPPAIPPRERWHPAFAKRYYVSGFIALSTVPLVLKANGADDMGVVPLIATILTAWLLTVRCWATVRWVGAVAVVLGFVVVALAVPTYMFWTLGSIVSAIFGGPAMSVVAAFAATVLFMLFA